MTFVLGLTGSIGMGKSRDRGDVPRARRAGPRCRRGGARALSRRAPPPLIEAAFPGTVADGRRRSRARSAPRCSATPSALKRLEAIVHPLVRAERGGVPRAAHAAARRRSSVLDIPLLFETGGEGAATRSLVVTAPAEVQRARVLARPGMTAEKLRGDPRASRCRTPKSGDGRISLWTRAAASLRPRRQVARYPARARRAAGPRPARGGRAI